MTLNAMLLTSPDDDEAEKERVRIEQEAQRRLEAALQEQHAHVTAAANTGHDAPREVAARVREAAGNLPTGSATEALRAALAAGADLGVRVAVNGFEPLGIAANWRLVHAQARSWAEHYAYDLIQGINATSLDRVSAAVTAWVESGAALDVLIHQLLPVFGPDRAEMIAQTETTRAYAQGSLDAYRASGVVTSVMWLTANDEHVCFPAGTMVRTENGDIPIQLIKPGMKVFTRDGLRSVQAVSKRSYNGPMTSINTEIGSVTATATHPFWTLEQGWLPCGKLTSSHTLETFDNQLLKIGSVFNFSVGDSANMPTIRFKIPSLSSIPFGIVPVDAVDLKCNTEIGKQKINFISSDLWLLDVCNTNGFKTYSNFGFKPIFTTKTTIANKAAKLPISVFGLTPKFFTTGFTLNNDRGTPAFLRTVMPVQTLLSGENLATPFAGNIFGVGDTTFIAANGITICNGGHDLKLFGANWADFGNHFSLGLLETISAAISPSLSGLRTGKISQFATSGTWDFFALAGKGVIAILRAKDVFTTAFSWLNRLFPTGGADILKWHGLQLLTSFLTLYQQPTSNAITVYDLQVEDVPEFYANGILVHNCPICAPLGGLQFDDGSAQSASIEHQETNAMHAGLDGVFVHPGGEGALAAFGGQKFTPPAHPRCRCKLGAIVD